MVTLPTHMKLLIAAFVISCVIPPVLFVLSFSGFHLAVTIIWSTAMVTILLLMTSTFVSWRKSKRNTRPQR